LCYGAEVTIRRNAGIALDAASDIDGAINIEKGARIAAPGDVQRTSYGECV